MWENKSTVTLIGKQCTIGCFNSISRILLLLFFGGGVSYLTKFVTLTNISSVYVRVYIVFQNTSPAEKHKYSRRDIKNNPNTPAEVFNFTHQNISLFLNVSVLNSIKVAVPDWFI